MPPLAVFVGITKPLSKVFCLCLPDKKHRVASTNEMSHILVARTDGSDKATS